MFPIVIGTVVGIFSLFLYVQIKKKGYVFLGTGFLISAIPSYVHAALGGTYLPMILLNRGLSLTEIGQFLSLLELFNGLLQIIFAILVLISLVLFRREFRSKT